MKSKKKTAFKNFDYLHCDDFAFYLMQMAQKGWHFKEWSAGLVFEQGTPEDVVYAVEVFIDGSEYDTRPGVHTQEFAAYCEAAGWQLVDAKRKFCIFKKIKPDAVDILTQEERLQNISREAKKKTWYQLILCTWFVALQLLQFTGSGFVTRIFSNPMLLITVLTTFLWLGSLIHCVQFYLWKAAARKKIQAGETVVFGRSKAFFFLFYDWYLWICLAVLFLFIPLSFYTGQYTMLITFSAIFFPTLILSFCVAKFRPDTATNQAIQIVVPIVTMIAVMVILTAIIFTDDAQTVQDEQIPLLYEQIGGNAGNLEGSFVDGSQSIFGSGLHCWLYYEESYLSYNVYQSKHGWILNKLWEDALEQKYNQNASDVTALWGADIALQNSLGEYLIRYPDAFIQITLPHDPLLTTEQTAAIQAALCESR